jgi:hypothetical protein
MAAWMPARLLRRIKVVVLGSFLCEDEDLKMKVPHETTIDYFKKIAFHGMTKYRNQKDHLHVRTSYKEGADEIHPLYESKTNYYTFLMVCWSMNNERYLENQHKENKLHNQICNGCPTIVLKEDNAAWAGGVPRPCLSQSPLWIGAPVETKEVSERESTRCRHGPRVWTTGGWGQSEDSA